MTTEEPTAAQIAEWAMTFMSVAFEELRAKAGAADTKLINEAWKVLHLASKGSPRSIFDEQTWIRHAALILLGGLAATSHNDDAPAAHENGATIDVAGLWRTLADGRLAEAKVAATIALDNLPPETNWQHGNVVHHAHLVLGYVCLRSDDVNGAAEHLLAAGQTPGSPALNSFGPNMSLALALLHEGKSDVVLQYFDECAAFWGKLPRWTAQVQAGETPDFGANLIYGIPDDVRPDHLVQQQL